MSSRPLIEHLEKELLLYKELVSVLQAETDNLVDRDYRALYETISRKEHLLVRIDSMAETRLALMRSTGASLGIDGFVNLSAIIEIMTGEERKTLRELQSTILSLIESIKELNKVNAIVVEGSLENIRKTLGLISNFMPKGGVGYGSSGGAKPVEVKGSVLSEGV